MNICFLLNTAEVFHVILLLHIPTISDHSKWPVMCRVSGWKWSNNTVGGHFLQFPQQITLLYIYITSNLLEKKSLALLDITDCNNVRRLWGSCSDATKKSSTNSALPGVTDYFQYPKALLGQGRGLQQALQTRVNTRKTRTKRIIFIH